MGGKWGARDRIPPAEKLLPRLEHQAWVKFRFFGRFFTLVPVAPILQTKRGANRCNDWDEFSVGCNTRHKQSARLGPLTYRHLSMRRQPSSVVATFCFYVNEVDFPS